MTSFASRGSKKWLQVAVNRKPGLLLGALHESGAVAPPASVTWSSPLEKQGFKEYRDGLALGKAGIEKADLKTPLQGFWPARGAVWDAIGITTPGRPLFLEAKAHIPEAASPATGAAGASLELIKQSLRSAMRFYAPRAKTDWSASFYQYANRLAHHYFLTRLNGVPSTLVFLYFLNADDMQGPGSEKEWHGAVRLIHAALGLPKDLKHHGVFDAFLDVRLLQGEMGSD
jgi:hypothetical protein